MWQSTLVWLQPHRISQVSHNVPSLKGVKWRWKWLRVMLHLLLLQFEMLDESHITLPPNQMWGYWLLNSLKKYKIIIGIKRQLWVQAPLKHFSWSVWDAASGQRLTWRRSRRLQLKGLKRRRGRSSSQKRRRKRWNEMARTGSLERSGFEIQSESSFKKWSNIKTDYFSILYNYRNMSGLPFFQVGWIECVTGMRCSQPTQPLKLRTRQELEITFGTGGLALPKFGGEKKPATSSWKPPNATKITWWQLSLEFI